MIGDMIAILILLFHTILDLIIYERTRKRQIYLMEELWDFEDYIKSWVREELRNQRPNETAAGIVQN